MKFSLKSLLIIVTVSAILIAISSYGYRTYQSAIERQQAEKDAIRIAIQNADARLVHVPTMKLTSEELQGLIQRNTKSVPQLPKRN